MKNTYCIMYTYKKRMPVQYCALLYSTSIHISSHIFSFFCTVLYRRYSIATRVDTKREFFISQMAFFAVFCS